MSIKTTGRELKAFWNDDSVWPGESHVDGVSLTVNGKDHGSEAVDVLADDDHVVLNDGYFCDENDEGESLLTVFRRWRKKQTVRTTLVEYPEGKLEEVKAALKAVGAKVIS